MAANKRYAQTPPEQRSAQGRRGYRGLMRKWAEEIDPDGAMPPDELAKMLKNRESAHFSELRLARMTKERHLRERQEKAALKAARAQGAGPSVAAVGPAGETTITQSARTGQEPR